MQVGLRPYATAGIALVGATAIAMTPVAPPLPEVQVASPPVALSASINPITPWIDVFNATSANATALTGAYFNAPFPVLQQLLVNQSDYLQQLLTNPADIGNVISQIGQNLQNAIKYATFIGLDSESEADLMLIAGNNDQWHSLMAAFLPLFLPPETPEWVPTLVNLLASPASGVLIGLVGPVLSPVVEALNVVRDVVTAATLTDALQVLISAPARVIGSVLNGSTLNLNFLLPLISGGLPEGVAINGVSFGFGGLLSPGGTFLAPGTNPEEHPEGLPGIGGSIFNSVGLDIDASGFVLNVAPRPLGPLAALTNLSQMIAVALGWDGQGNPLTKFKFPTIGAPEEPEAPEMSQLRAGADDDPGSAPELEQSKGTLVSVSTDSSNGSTTAPKAESGASGLESNTEAPAQSLVNQLSDEGTSAAGGSSTAAVKDKPGKKIADAVNHVRDQVKAAADGVRDNIKAAKEKRAEKRAERKAAKAESGSDSGE